MKKFIYFPLVLILFLGGVYYLLSYSRKATDLSKGDVNSTSQSVDGGGILEIDHPLSIAALKNGNYPGSEIVIEETLTPGSNYDRYIASYRSEGLKIYALLTVPRGNGEKYPVVVFNHGYIPPTQYRTTERYVAYVDGFARNGYIVFRPDYRGHGNSEGIATGSYGSSGYTIDVLNALASIKKFEKTDSGRIGMWGHSMGGHITLRNMVVSKDIKAGVIWAGVVASYEDLFSRWRRRNVPSTTPSTRGGSWRAQLTSEHGTPEENPEFWSSLSANSFLGDISGPIQLHHGTADTSVPVEFSEKLSEQLTAAGQEVELFTYPGDDHNISASFGTAMRRSIEFFDRYLKNDNS